MFVWAVLRCSKQSTNTKKSYHVFITNLVRTRRCGAMRSFIKWVCLIVFISHFSYAEKARFPSLGDEAFYFFPISFCCCCRRVCRKKGMKSFTELNGYRNLVYLCLWWKAKHRLGRIAIRGWAWHIQTQFFRSFCLCSRLILYAIDREHPPRGKNRDYLRFLYTTGQPVTKARGG